MATPGRGPLRRLVWPLAVAAWLVLSPAISDRTASAGMTGAPARVAAVATPPPTQAPLNPLFVNVLPQLQAALSVPVRLPVEVLTGGRTLYATAEPTDARSYSVTLGLIDNCRDASCVYGVITAGPSVVHAATDLRGSRVEVLANGDVAYVFKDCDTGCDPPYILWDEGPREYSIAMHGDLADRQFVEMADSMATY